MWLFKNAYIRDINGRVYGLKAGTIIGMETVSAHHSYYWAVHMIWDNFSVLILEQIAPSPTAHARICCEDFCGCRAEEMASEIPEIFYAFGPPLNASMSVGIFLKHFRRKLLQFE